MSDRSRPPETGDGRHFAPTRAPGRVKEVSSVSNPIVKDIRALAQKRHRDETGLFLAEGLKLVGDALDAGWEIQTLVIARAAAGHEFLEKTAARTVSLGGDVLEANAKVLEAIRWPSWTSRAAMSSSRSTASAIRAISARSLEPPMPRARRASS